MERVPNLIQKKIGKLKITRKRKHPNPKSVQTDRLSLLLVVATAGPGRSWLMGLLLLVLVNSNPLHDL